MGESLDEFPCNTEPCDMRWSDWSECSAHCGHGNRRRYTLCAQEAGGNVTNCKDLGLTSQAFEHIEECNTWRNDRNFCPRYYDLGDGAGVREFGAGPGVGDSCPKVAERTAFAACLDGLAYCECVERKWKEFFDAM